MMDSNHPTRSRTRERAPGADPAPSQRFTLNGRRFIAWSPSPVTTPENTAVSTTRTTHTSSAGRADFCSD